MTEEAALVASVEEEEEEPAGEPDVGVGGDAPVDEAAALLTDEAAADDRDGVRVLFPLLVLLSPADSEEVGGKVGESTSGAEHEDELHGVLDGVVEDEREYECECECECGCEREWACAFA
jgi:hypothetical protein